MRLEIDCRHTPHDRNRGTTLRPLELHDAEPLDGSPERAQQLRHPGKCELFRESGADPEDKVARFRKSLRLIHQVALRSSDVSPSLFGTCRRLGVIPVRHSYRAPAREVANWAEGAAGQVIA